MNPENAADPSMPSRPSAKKSKQSRLQRARPRPLALEARLIFDAEAGLDPSRPGGTADIAGLPADGIHAETADHDKAPVHEPQAGDKASPEAPVAEPGAPAPGSVRNIVFIDTNLVEWQKLAAAAEGTGALVVTLDPTDNGIARVSEVLARHTGLNSIQFLTHGEGGRLHLGQTVVTGGILAAQAGEIAAWGGSLREGGDILLWSCDLASTANGRAIVAELARLTGADVAASIDATGDRALGGNWDLEHATGEVDMSFGQALQSAGYDKHLLDAPRIDLGGGALNFGTPTLFTGTALSAGAVYKYTNVATVSGTQIDAYVEIVSITNATIEDIDDPNPTSDSVTHYNLNYDVGGTPNNFPETGLFAPQIKITAAGGNVEFRIFFRDPSNNILTLLDFYNNSIDIDGTEFVEYGGFDYYELASGSPNTDLNATPANGDRIRFAQKSTSTNYTGVGLNDQGRVQTHFDAITSLTIVMGSTAAQSSGEAGRQFGSIFAYSQQSSSIIVTAPTVVAQVTNDNTPTIVGTVGSVAIGPSEVFKVTVNGVTYTRGVDAALTVGTNTWSLTIPTPLADGTYHVTATRGSTPAVSDQTSNELVIDTVAPVTASIVVADTSLIKGETSLVTITFSEVVSGFDNSDLTVQGGTLSNVSTSDGGKTWTATFTPTDNIENTSRVITLNNAGVTDRANNPGTGTTTSNTYDIDTIRPVLTITSDKPAVYAGQTVLLTFSFSQAPSGFAQGDVQLESGGLSDFTQVNATTWTARYTPAASTNDAAMAVSVAGSSFGDAAGNIGEGHSLNLLVNTVAPTATVVVDDSALKIGDIATVTITFDKAVTGLTLAAFNVQNGALSNLQTSNNVVYTATLTPASSVEDTSNVITLDLSGVQDANANPGAGTVDSNNYAVDTVAPTVAISASPSSLKAGETTTLTITFSEAPVDFTVADISVESGSLGTLTPTADPKVFTVIYTPASGTEDAAMLVSIGTGYTDAAGNTGTAGSLNIPVDTVPPTATLTIDSVTADNVVNADEAAGTVTITGTVTGARDGDAVTLTINGTDYTGTVSSGTFSIANVSGADLAADADQTIAGSVTATDAAGNSAVATTTKTYAVDTVPPTATITINSVTADNVVNAAEAAGTVTITGTVTGARDGDAVKLTINGTDYTGTVSSGTFSIANVLGSDLAVDADQTIDGAVTATDAAGNSAAATTTKTYDVDTVPPTATITIDSVTSDNVVNAAEAAGTVTITGTVTGARDGDTVTLTINGVDYTGAVSSGTFSIVNVSGSDLVADADQTIDGEVTATDAAGNSAVATTAKTYAVDTVPPTATITIDSVTSDNVVNAAEAAGTVTITGTVTGARDGDTVTLTINGTDYTGTVSSGTFSIANVTGSDLTADADQTIAGSVIATDAAGNSTVATTMKTYTVDTVPPTATITIDSVTSDNVVNAAEAAGTVTITGSVTGARDGDTVTLTINGTDYTGTVSSGTFSIASVSGSDLEADADQTIDGVVTATDAAGNSAAATTTKTYDVDTVPPTATITIDSVTSDNVVNAAEAAGTVTITGTVTGARDGDAVTLTINGTDYTGTVSSGTFSIANVLGSDLAADADQTIAGSVTATDAAGNSAVATTTKTYAVDTVPPTASLTINSVTADNLVNVTEAAGTVTITGSATGARDGDVVTLVVNGQTYTGTVLNGTFAINVAGGDLAADADRTIEASVAITTATGNTATATGTRGYLVGSAQASAGNDVLTIGEDDVSGSGNVLANDSGEGAVRVTSAGTGGTSVAVGDSGAALTGTFGTLVIRADGSYTYTLNGGDPTVDGLNTGDVLGENFTYTITDASGQTATATISITIKGVTDLIPPVENPPVLPGDPVVPPPATPRPPAGETPIVPVPPPGESLPSDLSGGDGLGGRLSGIAGFAVEEFVVTTTGFPVAVVPSQTEALQLFKGVPDQFNEADSEINFTIPSDAFAHSNSDAQITLSAVLTDGRPLPSWLLFDGETGTFKGVPPSGFTGLLVIKVVARDQNGREAEAIFRFNVGRVASIQGEPRAQVGFSEQIRRMAFLQRQGSSLTLARR